MEINCWLPPMELYDPETEWEIYSDLLYSIFENDFIENPVYYLNEQVNVRKHPMYNNKHDSYFHITCKIENESNERIPDYRRCERIRWIKSFIENYLCNNNECKCNGMKVWNEPYKSTYRTHILLVEQRYMVVLEKRRFGYLLVTAFYFHYQHALMKKIKKYEKFKNNNTNSK